MNWKALLYAALYGAAFVLILSGFSVFLGSNPTQEYRDISEMVIGGLITGAGIALIWYPVTTLQHPKD